MASMTVYLTYEGPTGVPVTIARLTDPGIVQQVAQLAVGSRCRDCGNRLGLGRNGKS